MLTLEEIRRRKKELGFTNEMLADRSGVPLATVQKVLAGVTKAPRRRTLEALSKAFPDPGEALLVCDSHPAEAAPKQGGHTIDEILALPEGVRAELIDGEIYYMATPRRIHQKIVGEMYLTIANYIRAKGGACEVWLSPFGVFLNADDSIYVEPDLIVVCEPDKVEERGCVGAPDWVVEVESPSSRKLDGVLKLRKYREAGVREYWIVHPDKRMIQIYYFGEDEDVALYSFDDEISSGIVDGLTIRLADTV